MRNYTLIFLVFTFLINSGCGNDSKNRYNFPDKTIVSSIEEESCFDGVIEKGIGAASNFEQGALDIISGSISLKKQQEIGENYHNELKEQYTFIEDGRWNKLKMLLRKMTNFVEKKRIKYSIFLIEDPADATAVNAFTHVGGYIYVTTELMKFVDSDDELAFIIGHEMGHNENEHILRQLQRNKGMGFLSSGYTNEITNILSLILTSYNQIDELEADRAGAYLSYKTGYHPEKGTDFFDKISKNENEHILNTLIRSHPYSARRANCIKEYLNNHKVK